MKIQVSKDAAKWYKEELHLGDSAHVRFYVRYGGVGGQIPGFSLGLNYDIPSDIHASAKVENITFYIAENDAWYFEDKDLKINFNEKRQEPEFLYV